MSSIKLPTLVLATASLLGLAGCAVPESRSDEAQSTGEGAVVQEPPTSDDAQADRSPGRSQPGPAAHDESSAPPTEVDAPDGRARSGTTAVYTDTTHGFSLVYPADFVVRVQPAEKLAKLVPMPVTSATFMNPTAAASDLGDLEPADLEIRVHSAGPTPVDDGALKEWLMARSVILPDGSIPVRPFQSDHASGLEVCAATMIAPGCSYFIAGGRWVYQLTAATLEGEAMVKAFTLVQ